MRFKLRAMATMVALLCAVALALLPAGAASAATPQCTQAVAHYPSSGAGPLLVPAASNGNRSCWMQKGNNSSAVAALQYALRDCYGEDLEIDGDFGGLTKAALIRVQGQVGAAPDGGYGPETARKMQMSATFSTNWWDCSWQTF